MANYLDSATIPVAAPEKNKFDLGTQHITTSDFMELDCAYVKEMVPGEKIDIQMETFSRMNSMPVPGFGRAVIKKSKFFVPFRQICPSFTDFMADTVHINSANNHEFNVIPQGVPTVTNSQLVELFLGDATMDPSVSATTYTEASLCYPPFNTGITDDVDFAIVDAYDFVVVTGITGSTNAIQPFNFTDTGRKVFKCLQQLGYDIVWTTVTGDTGYDNTYSALPILGWIKCFCDWYWPAQYSNVALYQHMLNLCKSDTGVAPTINVGDLRDMLKQIQYVMYDSSYFSSCWDTPNQPAPGNYSDDFRIKNIDTLGQIYGSSKYNIYSQNGVSNNTADAVNNGGALDRYGRMDAPFLTLYAEGGTGSTGNFAVTGGISEYILKALKALTSFMKRNQLVGSRAYERMMARYGVSTPSEKLNRAVFLGSETQAIQISDVTSTSDTEGANLGNFAGKGMSYGTTHLQYETDEFGYVYIFTSIVPIAQTFQGIDPMVQRIDRTQFYVPEFDSLGVEAVPAISMYTPALYSNQYAGLKDQVFGFLPRYSTYKSAVKDKLTGNFRCGSLQAYNPFYPMATNGASSWHLMREFDQYQYPAASGIVHSINYMYGNGDNWQYKRIFYGGALDEKLHLVNPDNFTIIHNFEVASYAPMKKLYDVIDELEVDAEHKHKNVKLQVGGVKVN